MHTDYSLLDGACDVDRKATGIKRLSGAGRAFNDYPLGLPRFDGHVC